MKFVQKPNVDSGRIFVTHVQENQPKISLDYFRNRIIHLTLVRSGIWFTKQGYDYFFLTEKYFSILYNISFDLLSWGIYLAIMGISWTRHDPPSRRLISTVDSIWVYIISYIHGNIIIILSPFCESRIFLTSGYEPPVVTFLCHSAIYYSVIVI